MNRLPLLLAILIASLAHPTVYACSCRTTSPAVEFNEAKAIFIGKVFGGTESWQVEMDDGRPLQLEAGNVRVFVDEVFKGTLGAEAIIAVSSMKGTSCGDYGLVRFASYVIYAYEGRDKKGLYTGVCTRTALLNDAKEDLDFLRNLPSPGSGGNLRGFVWANLRGDTARLPNVKVNIRVGDKVTRTARTDSNGLFEVNKLEPGRYVVEPELPENYVLEQKSVEVEIEDRGTAEVGFVVYLNGTVSGTIIDRDGSGFKSAFLHLVSRDVEEGKSIYGHSTGEGGDFSVAGVPPGEYVLYLELTGESYDKTKRFYYPGTYEIAGAMSIKVALGEKVEGLRFYLPDDFKVRTIAGRVVWKDGKAAANVQVLLLCPRSSRDGGFAVEFGPTSTVTDEEGNFEIEGFAGETYWIEARGLEKRASAEPVYVHSPTRKLVVTENLKGMRLSLSEKGIGGGCQDDK